MKKRKKLRVGILFGGKSAEHEISLRSAKNVLEALDKNKYDVTLIGIDKAGRWQLRELPTLLKEATIPPLGGGSVSKEVALIPQSAGELIAFNESSPTEAIDVVFPILHGPFGEDGTVQGLLKLANVPFVGAGVLGSAVGMDKDIMKRLLREAGLPVTKFLVIHGEEKLPTFETVKRQLGIPFFVKPANLGSSVGVHRVKTKEEYKKAAADAFQFDTKILLEKFVRGREIECAVLGNESPIASVVGEIIPTHEFYSYESKYIDENGARLEIPAKLPKGVGKKVREMALRVFKVLACEGLARVDFFVTAQHKIFVNEINTIPGFTSVSMYPQLFAASGISYRELIDRLLQLAIERFEKEKNLKTSYTD